MRQFLCRLFRMPEDLARRLSFSSGCFSTDDLQNKRYFPAIVLFNKQKSQILYCILLRKML